MGINFTEKQEQVIKARDCNLLVAAAAGSGKTAVLVERIIQRICDREHPVDIDRLLVVTFTNAAAAQMRERISEAIGAQLAVRPEDEHLQRQAALLHNAQITTIDSFCLFVIRNHFHTIGLDPGFRIADEGEIKLLQKDVMEEVLEEGYVRDDPEFLNCMEYFSTGSRDTDVEEIILKLYDFAMSNPFPEQWLALRKQDYQMETEGFEQLPWVAEFLQESERTVAGFIEKLQDAIKICEQPDGPYMYASLLETEVEMLEAIHQCFPKPEGDFDTLCTIFEKIAFERLPSKKDDSVNPAKRELAKDIRTQVKEDIQKLRDRYFFQTKAQICRQSEVCGRAVDALIDIVLKFKECFDLKKRERNLVDFDDIEHFALDILVKQGEDGECHPTDTALEYRQYFEEILIDEYQDSNLVQEYLLSCISGEQEDRFNRFMVGDVKQSIYKFRLARPELFLEKYEQYKEQNGSKKMRIDLHENFRSRHEVLDSTNAIFSQIMGKEVGGIVYDEQAALHTGASYPESADKETELLLFQTKDKPEDIAVREQEAYGVACKIKKLMQSCMVTVRDGEEASMRKLCYKDIVILLRSAAGWDEVFKRILEEEGIPVHMTAKTGYFAATEVQQLLQFLQILDNPLQDIPLYGVLHSYLGGFTEEEIALLCAATPKRKYLWDALTAVMEPLDENEPLPIPSELINRIRDFYEGLLHYREMSTYCSAGELLRSIIRDTGYLEYVAVKSDGNKAKANVEMLLVKAAEYEKTSYFGLYHFLRYIEQLEKYEVDYGEAGLPDENADVVRIMSIHKSKGLEFPVCFVCGLSKNFQTRDSGGHVVLDVETGIGVDYMDTSMRVRGRNIRRNAIAAKLYRDNLAEEIRILYVAMTRAKEKLIMTGTVKDIQKTVASLLTLRGRKEEVLPGNVLLDCGCYMDLILAALCRNKCMDAIYEQTSCEVISTPLYDRDMYIQVTLENWEDTVMEEVESEVIGETQKVKLLNMGRKEAQDKALHNQMQQFFAYRYPHENLKNLYTKTTVSELKKAGMPYEEESAVLFPEREVDSYLPKFLKGEEKVTGTTRGSAYHKVMELFDFADLLNIPKEQIEVQTKEQIEKMHADGRLSDDYFDVVSTSKIAGFMKSEAAIRMAKAAAKGKLYKEQPFVLGLPASELNTDFPARETVLIQGIIDVFFEEEDGYVVLDYKTDTLEKPEDFVKRYQIQLEYYAKALEQLSGYAYGREGKRVKEKIIYSFGLAKEIEA